MFEPIMLTQFFTIALLVFLAALMPGPVLVLVTRNTISHSRYMGFLTTLGVGCAILVHITYCLFGLAIIISRTPSLFITIKYIGATYIIYLGLQSLLNLSSKKSIQTQTTSQVISRATAFQQGFLCNLLNPKATLFFLALFTVIIKPHTPYYWLIIYSLEIFSIYTGWYFFLTFILSNPRILPTLQRMEKYIAKLLGLFLVGLGLGLVLIK